MAFRVDQIGQSLRSRIVDQHRKISSACFEKGHEPVELCLIGEIGFVSLRRGDPGVQLLEAGFIAPHGDDPLCSSGD